MFVAWESLLSQLFGQLIHNNVFKDHYVYLSP